VRFRIAAKADFFRIQKGNADAVGVTLFARIHNADAVLLWPFAQLQFSLAAQRQLFAYSSAMPRLAVEP
jgi:hypothetical protein